MANQFYVEPAQFGPGLSALAGSVQQFGEQQRAQQKAAEQEAYAEQAKQAMTQAFQSGDPRQIMQVGIQYPEVSETMQQLYGFTNDMTEQAAKEGYRRFLATQDPSERLAILEGTVDTISQLGGRPVLSQQDVERFKRDPEGTAKSIEMAYAGIDPEGYSALTGGQPGDPAGVREFRALVDAAQSEDPTVSDAARVRLGLKPRAGLSAQERIAQDRELSEMVARQERLESGEKEAGKQAVQQSGEAFKKLQVVRSSLPKYDRAIELVKQGANTGALASRFPSLTAETVELENLQRQLGLDVISAVTFGALSEKEMDVALQTALPTTLDGPELIDWLETKKRSQEKLANYLADAAQFLGTPGNTVADWMAKGKGSQAENEDQAVNWSDL